MQGDDDPEEAASLVTPKKSKLSRVAIQRNAAKRSSLLPFQLPTRDGQDEDDRPNYSAASLQELRNSTPSTPRDLNITLTEPDADEISTGTQALDISSKFGSSLAHYQQQTSAIPSAAEIAEKKARRARLAKEQQAEEYISLDPSDPELESDDDDNVMKDEHGRLVLKPKDKYHQAESRLVRDDEDIMENFDEFTEDGKISLSRNAEAEAARKRKIEMAAQIADAEGALSDDIDSDASERERNAAFEAAQTKHGTYAQNAEGSNRAGDIRPRTPPIITPLPSLEGVIERLRTQVSEMQNSRMQKLQEMEALQREKIRLAEEEVRIQRALKETAEKFEQLRKEKGISVARNDEISTVGQSSGLELSGEGNMELIPGETERKSRADTDAGFAGLGFGASRRGLGALGLGMQSAEDSEDSAA